MDGPFVRYLKGYIQKAAPWMEMIRCLAERLELALKYALKNTTFKSIDELKQCMTPTDMPMQGVTESFVLGVHDLFVTK